MRTLLAVLGSPPAGSLALALTLRSPPAGSLALALTLLLLVTACASLAPEAGQAGPPEAVDGLRVDRVVSGLAGPTQMTFGPDGRLWVAQLNGGENDQRGQVLAIDLGKGEGERQRAGGRGSQGEGDREVVVDGLDKPTGIAWLDDDLWIATRDAVLRAEGGSPGEPAAVLSGLPNNGRSNGTLTATPDGTLLYETSGRERQGGFVEGSGTLWELDPADPDEPQPVATGLKNAYAHVFDGDGALWSTEIAESIGDREAPDELNRIERGADYGWPACVGDRQPVAAFDGDRERCQGTVRPVTEFAPSATATSIVVNPFADGELIVTLWVTGQVVSVDAGGAGESRPFVEGLPRPQSLLVDGDTVLVSDHQQGAIYRVSAP